LPTDLIVHAGFDMELATCPAGDSNRAQTEGSHRQSGAGRAAWSLHHQSIVDELVERAAFATDEGDEDLDTW
jgi:hypothetical protein